MNQAIGTIAGRIWRHLQHCGSATLPRLARELDVAERVIAMSVGWLAREGKVDFVSQGRTLTIQLNPNHH